MQKYLNTITNGRNPIAGARVTVTTTDGPPAALYSDNGVTALGVNYVTTDANGYFEFYAADGRYNLAISGPGINARTISDVLLEDPADDKSAIAEAVEKADAAVPAASLAAAGGAALVGFRQSGTGAATRTAQDKLREIVSVKDFGAVGDGATDDTAAIQAAIDAVAAAGGGTLLVPVGTFMASRITLKTGVYIAGAGYDVTRIKQIAGSNQDFIISDGLGVSDIHRFGLERLEVDGNYFTSAWNAASGTTGNTSGAGLKLQGYAGIIDIGLTNVAGVGAHFVEPNAGETSAQSDYIGTVSIVGKDFGKEGIIIEGPNDWHLKKVWIGRAGILPRPAAETAFATSDVYPGEQVDGIVIDGANIEVGDVHVYACWSGCGFRTRNTVRLTKGGRIISESNNSQVDISSGTYGSAFFDARNLSLHHPNWTAAAPSYTNPNRRWDAVTIDADQFSAEVTVKRTITATSRVAGTAGVVINGGAKVDVIYNNATAPTGDPEAGVLYSGDAVQVRGIGSQVTANVRSVNGNGVHVLGEANDVSFVASSCVSGAALRRDSQSNSKRGNHIRGSVYRCATGFQAVGTPTAERISLAMELQSGQAPFAGDTPDLSRGQVWDISASVNNVDFSTRKFLSATLDATDTTAKTLVVPHEFLYTPDYRQVQITLDDRATPSLTPPQYLVVNNIDATNITIAYKFSATPDAAANYRVNVRVG